MPSSQLLLVIILSLLPFVCAVWPKSQLSFAYPLLLGSSLPPNTTQAVRELQPTVAIILECILVFLAGRQVAPNAIYIIRKYGSHRLANIFCQTHGEVGVLLQELAEAAFTDDTDFDCVTFNKAREMKWINQSNHHVFIGHYGKIYKARRPDGTTWIGVYFGSGHGGYDLSGGKENGGIWQRWRKYDINAQSADLKPKSLPHEYVMGVHSSDEQLFLRWIIVGHSKPDSTYKIIADGTGVTVDELFAYAGDTRNRSNGKDSLMSKLEGLASGLHTVFETVTLVLGGILGSDASSKRLVADLCKKGIDVISGQHDIKRPDEFKWFCGNQHLPILDPKAGKDGTVSRQYLDSIVNINWEYFKPQLVDTSSIPLLEWDDSDQAYRVTSMKSYPNSVDNGTRKESTEMMKTGLLSGDITKYDVVHGGFSIYRPGPNEAFNAVLDEQMRAIHAITSPNAPASPFRAIWVPVRGKLVIKRDTLDADQLKVAKAKAKAAKTTYKTPSAVYVQLKINNVDDYGGLLKDGSGWNMVFRDGHEGKVVGQKDLLPEDRAWWIPLVALARVVRYTFPRMSARAVIRNPALRFAPKGTIVLRKLEPRGKPKPKPKLPAGEEEAEDEQDDTVAHAIQPLPRTTRRGKTQQLLGPSASSDSLVAVPMAGPAIPAIEREVVEPMEEDDVESFEAEPKHNVQGTAAAPTEDEEIDSFAGNDDEPWRFEIEHIAAIQWISSVQAERYTQRVDNQGRDKQGRWGAVKWADYATAEWQPIEDLLGTDAYLNYWLDGHRNLPTPTAQSSDPVIAHEANVAKVILVLESTLGGLDAIAPAAGINPADDWRQELRRAQAESAIIRPEERKWPDRPDLYQLRPKTDRDLSGNCFPEIATQRTIGAGTSLIALDEQMDWQDVRHSLPNHLPLAYRSGNRIQSNWLAYRN